VSFLLKRNPNHRFEACQALQHRWLKQEEEQVEFDDDLVDKLRGFRTLNKFKKAALHLIVSMLSEGQTEKSRSLFVWLDLDCDGLVSMADLTGRLGEDIADDLEDIFKEGDIYYTEFLAATFERGHINQSICKAAFSVFDQDNSKTITKDELAAENSLLGHLSAEETQQLLEDFDENGDGVLDLGEFSQMMSDSISVCSPRGSSSPSRSNSPSRARRESPLGSRLGSTHPSRVSTLADFQIPTAEEDGQRHRGRCSVKPGTLPATAVPDPRSYKRRASLPANGARLVEFEDKKESSPSGSPRSPRSPLSPSSWSPKSPKSPKLTRRSTVDVLEENAPTNSKTLRTRAKTDDEPRRQAEDDPPESPKRRQNRPRTESATEPERAGLRRSVSSVSVRSVKSNKSNTSKESAFERKERAGLRRSQSNVSMQSAASRGSGLSPGLGGKPASLSPRIKSRQDAANKAKQSRSSLLGGTMWGGNTGATGGGGGIGTGIGTGLADPRGRSQERKSTQGKRGWTSGWRPTN